MISLLLFFVFAIVVFYKLEILHKVKDPFLFSADRIHMSQATFKILSRYDTYEMHCRGLIDIKVNIIYVICFMCHLPVSLISCVSLTLYNLYKLYNLYYSYNLYSFLSFA